MMYEEVLRELAMFNLEKGKMGVGKGSSCCASLLNGELQER